MNISDMHKYCEKYMQNNIIVTAIRTEESLCVNVEEKYALCLGFTWLYAPQGAVLVFT